MLYCSFWCTKMFRQRNVSVYSAELFCVWKTKLFVLMLNSRLSTLDFFTGYRSFIISMRCRSYNNKFQTNQVFRQIFLSISVIILKLIFR